MRDYFSLINCELSFYIGILSKFILDKSNVIKESKSKIIVIRLKSKLRIFENKFLVLTFFLKINFKMKKQHRSK